MRLRVLSMRVLLACATAGLAALLTACANLDAVRDFGTSAARMTAYPRAAEAYRDSALTSAAYVGGSPQSFVDPASRSRQAAAALKLQLELGRYFSTLARLAGEDTFSIDKQLNTLAGGVAAVPDSGLDSDALKAYTGLAKALSRFATLGVQESAVKELVNEGGPHAMRIIDSLRQTALDWSEQVRNDARQIDNTLEVAVLPRDVPPLLRVLATDRRQTLKRQYEATQLQFKHTMDALDAVQKAHASMVAELDQLGGDALRKQLQSTSADLKAVTAQLAVLR